MVDSTLSKLDDRFMLTTLVFLKHNRPAIKSEIYSSISRNTNMKKKIEALQEMNLISVYQSDNVNTNYIVLTDKGEKVANLIEDIISEIEKNN